MATTREYFIEDQRFTPSQFKRLSKARQVEAMVQWFYSRYQDPSNETPYNGREGGFQYIYGGPYDADTEIQVEFSDLADFETMQEAVNEVTSEGIYEWAPVDQNREPELDDDGIYPIDMPFPDISNVEDPPELPELPPGQSYLTNENGDPLTDQFGNPLIVNTPVNRPAFAEDEFAGNPFTRNIPTADPREIERLRREMLARFDHLEQVINRSISVAANRGHNQPPELLEVDRILGEQEAADVRQALALIRDESAREIPDKEVVVSGAGTLKKVATGLAAAAAIVGGFVLEEVASLEIAIQHAKHRQEVIDALVGAYDFAVAWANALPSAF